MDPTAPLRLLRETRGLSSAEAAGKIGISHELYIALESDPKRMLDLLTVDDTEKLCRELGTSIRSLFRGAGREDRAILFGKRKLMREMNAFASLHGQQALGVELPEEPDEIGGWPLEALVRVSGNLGIDWRGFDFDIVDFPIALEDQNMISHFVGNIIRAGFTDPHDVIIAVPDFYPDVCEDHATLISFAAQCATDANRMLIEEQKNWPAVTDWDRLVSAFLKLEASGIATYHYVEASPEVEKEVYLAYDQGRAVRGAVLYQPIDTVLAIRGQGLYLYFNALSPESSAHTTVGHEIVTALKAEGLTVNWNGTMESRILAQMKWQRRFPRRMAPPANYERMPWRIEDDVSGRGAQSAGRSVRSLSWIGRLVRFLGIR